MANALASKAKNALREVKTNPRNALLDFTRGALMGVSTDVLGYPVDVATMAMRPFGYNVEKPVGGSDWLADRVTSPTGAPAETAGRFLTGMVTPGPNELMGAMGVTKQAPVNELITYHGSPHRINNVDEANPMGKFDLSKVGTGEGAQAYGHGIYLAQTRGVAEQYKPFGENQAVIEYFDRAGNKFVPKNQQLDDLGESADYLYRNFGSSKMPVSPEIISQVESARALPGNQNKLAVLAGLKLRAEHGISESVGSQSGHLYTVDLPDEHIAKMLDWDAPLSEQPEAVRKALKNYAAADDASITGGEFYRRLTQEFGAGQDEVSAALLKDGVPGIRYLDGNSRTTSFGPQSSGTRNFVIFDGDYAKILKRE